MFLFPKPHRELRKPQRLGPLGFVYQRSTFQVYTLTTINGIQSLCVHGFRKQTEPTWQGLYPALTRGPSRQHMPCWAVRCSGHNLCKNLLSALKFRRQEFKRQDGETDILCPG